MARNEVATWSGRAVLGAAAAVACGAGLSACASVSPQPLQLADRGGANASGSSLSGQPASSGAIRRYKVGAPYMAGGVWYVPAAQPGYDEVGLASWYGAGYDGKATADGEIYHMNDLSAAHATLPLPSIVEVTNLENGRRIELRINDRGPFHPGRIIDLSRAAADRLGFGPKGTAKVRVRYLRAAPLLDQPSQTLARFDGGRSGTPWTRALPSVAPPDEGARSPPSAPGGFAVQAGAFSERTNAERAAARLASAGRTTIQSVQRGGGLLYRVTVGSFHSPQEAGRTRNRIASLGFSGARVVSGS